MFSFIRIKRDKIWCNNFQCPKNFVDQNILLIQNFTSLTEVLADQQFLLTTKHFCWPNYFLTKQFCWRKKNLVGKIFHWQKIFADMIFLLTKIFCKSLLSKNWYTQNLFFWPQIFADQNYPLTINFHWPRIFAYPKFLLTKNCFTRIILTNIFFWPKYFLT